MAIGNSETGKDAGGELCPGECYDRTRSAPINNGGSNNGCAGRFCGAQDDVFAIEANVLPIGIGGDDDFIVISGGIYCPPNFRIISRNPYHGGKRYKGQEKNE